VPKEERNSGNSVFFEGYYMKKMDDVETKQGSKAPLRRGDFIPTTSGDGLLLAIALTGGLIDERTARQEIQEERHKYGDE
jgi:hypothetical protein